MEVGRTMGGLSKRESDAQKLLDLLANPFRAQVGCSMLRRISLSNGAVVITKFSLRKFRHIDRIYSTTCDRLFASSTV